MKDYVLDANAVLRYFGVGDGQGGEKVRGLFEQAQRNESRLTMSVINLGEVLYILLKHIGQQRALQYIQALQHAVTVMDADVNQTLQAATLKH
ncbi:MAG: PIN domain-containing protein [Acidobacteriota bacterium]|nr:PIN domain-containing protein [Acidobacteriota bacterium]